MKYDKNGLPVKEWYKKQLEIPFEDKLESEKNQKYYTGGAIIFMFIVLISMYFVLS